MTDARDERFMSIALEQAVECVAHGDVPVGCVVVRGDELIGRAGNQRELLNDPTAHAEIMALRQAADAVSSWRLEGCTLYVTLEPCAMCAGAMVSARVDRVVFGAADPKSGFAGSLGNLLQDERLNHRIDLDRGILADRSAHVLREFFRDRR